MYLILDFIACDERDKVERERGRKEEKKKGMLVFVRLKTAPPVSVYFTFPLLWLS